MNIGLRYLIVLVTLGVTVAKSQPRTWTLTDGSQIQGEIESWGTKWGPGDLAIKNELAQVKEYFLSDFSPADQAYLQTLRVPWKRVEQMSSFALFGSDLFNLDSGTIVGKSWMLGAAYGRNVVQSVAGGLNDMFFVQSGAGDATKMGFTVPSKVGVKRPYLFQSGLLGQPVAGDSLATGSGVSLSADFTSAIFFKDGDLWSATPDWWNNKLKNEKKVTSVGVLNDPKLLLWFDHWVYLWGGLSKDKPVLKIDLSTGSVEEIGSCGVFGPGNETFTNPSSSLVCLANGATLHIYDPRSGKAWRMRNHPDNGSREVLIGNGHPMKWLDDNRFVVFVSFRQENAASANHGEVSQFYLADIRTDKIQTIDIGNVTQTQLDSDDDFVITKFVTFLPDNQAAFISQSPHSDEDKVKQGPKYPSGYALVDFSTGSVSRLPFTSIDQITWLNDQFCLYTRSTGGLAAVGTWLYDRKSNKSQRALAQQADFRTLGNSAYFEDRNEIWFQVQGPSNQSVELYRINLLRGSVDRVTNLPAGAYIISRLSPTPIDLGISDKEKSSYLSAVQRARAESAAKAEAAARATPVFKILQTFNRYSPYPVLVVQGSDKALYGSAVGGRFNSGMLFRIQTDGSHFEVLHEFEGPEEGLTVNSLVKSAGGILFGSTVRKVDFQPNGDPNFGIIPDGLFKYAPNERNYAILYASKEPQNGWQDALSLPLVGTATPEGILYGKCDQAAVFRFETKERVLDVIHNAYWATQEIQKTGTQTFKRDYRDESGRGPFRSQSGSQQTGDALIQVGDRLYSVTETGGRGNEGRMVSMSLKGEDFKTVYDFSSRSPEGGTPSSSLVVGHGDVIYGVCKSGGQSQNGSIFQLKPDTGECRAVLSFDRNTDPPRGALAQGPDDWIYFVIREKICRVKPDGTQSSVLYAIKDDTIRAGGQPAAALVCDSDGVLYGSIGGLVFSLSLPGSGSGTLTQRSPTANRAENQQQQQGILEGTDQEKTRQDPQQIDDGKHGQLQPETQPSNVLYRKQEMRRGADQEQTRQDQQQTDGDKHGQLQSETETSNLPPNRMRRGTEDQDQPQDGFSTDEAPVQPKPRTGSAGRSAQNAEGSASAQESLILRLNSALDQHDYETVLSFVPNGRTDYFGHRNASSSFIEKDMQADARNYRWTRSNPDLSTFRTFTDANGIVHESIQMETAAQEISGKRHHAFVQLDISYRNEDPPSILSMEMRVLK